MDGLENKLPHGLRYEGAWKPIGHVHNKLVVSNVYTSKTETRACFIRDSLIVLIKWLIDCHLSQVYMNVLDSGDNLSEILLLGLVERAVYV